MAYKSGEKVLGLNNERVIGVKRLWVARIVYILGLLSAVSSALAMGVTGLAGAIVGSTLVYWVLIQLLSSSQDTA